MKKTIILLSEKRCGTTAIYNMFRKHPDVNICHVNQDIKFQGEYLLETNYWIHAVEAINGNSKCFINEFSKSCPFLEFPTNITEGVVFDLWDKILEELGPVVFFKSPSMLSSLESTDLLKKYKDLGRKVKIFSIIRNPLDAITSMYLLWGNNAGFKYLVGREKRWLKKYNHLEKLIQSKELGDIPLFKYEEFSNNPKRYGAEMFEFCGLRDCPSAYNHIKPVNVGRYKNETNLIIKEWISNKMSVSFKEHLKKYGYLE